MAAKSQEGIAEFAIGDRAVRHGHAGGDRAALSGDALQADQQEHHAERRQQVRHAHIDDQPAVDQADNSADEQADNDRDDGVLLQHHHDIGRRHHGRCGDRADRQVEAANDQGGGDAERQHAGDGHRLEDEDGTLWRDEAVGGDREIGDQPEQQDDEAVADGVVAQRHSAHPSAAAHFTQLEPIVSPFQFYPSPRSGDAVQRSAGDLGQQAVEIDVGIAVFADDCVFRHHQDAVGRLQRLVEFGDE